MLHEGVVFPSPITFDLPWKAPRNGEGLGVFPAEADIVQDPRYP